MGRRWRSLLGFVAALVRRRKLVAVEYAFRRQPPVLAAAGGGGAQCDRPGIMRLYADHPDRRFRQIIGDVLGIVALVGAIPAGAGFYHWLKGYAEPGAELELAADALAGNLLGTADTLGRIPLVGDSVAEPLSNAGDSAAAIADAGRSLQDFVGATAVFAGALLAVAVVAAALAAWLRPRLEWLAEADAARAIRHDPDGLDVLAFRALASAPAVLLQQSGQGALAAWRAGDPAVIRSLAELEMARLGLSLTPALS